MKRILIAFTTILLLVTSCYTEEELAEFRRIREQKEALHKELREEARQIDKQLSSTFYSIGIDQFTFREHTIYWFTSGGGDHAVGGPIHIPDLCQKCNPDCNLKPEEKANKVLSEYETLFGTH